MQDCIITALKVAQRNPKLIGIFNKVLAESQVHTLVRPGQRACLIRGTVSGETRDYIACFSNPVIAEQTLKIYGNLAGNNTATAQIRPINALKLFFSAARGEMAIYLNPKNAPNERIFFDSNAVKGFLLGPWALNLDPAAKSSGRSRLLTRSRQGRTTIDGKNTRIPISEIDFDLPFTTRQLAEIFGVSENIIVKEITELEQRGILDLSADSILINQSETGQSQENVTRYYDPVVAFHLGYQISSPRGNEFRRWHTRLLHDFCGERRTLEEELEQLKGQLKDADLVIQSLKSELHEKSERISELDALPNNDHDSLNRLTQELLQKNKLIAELKADLEAAGEWLYPESVAEACKAAQARYGSKLVFHERVAQAVNEFALNNDLKATLEAVKMFKALADCLHPLKFDRDNFSEEQFRNETGITLSMTESKTTKRDKAFENTRICYYQGRKITFYPHLKRSVQGIQIRLHFQFLTDERKILICHVGDHLPNAQTKHLK